MENLLLYQELFIDQAIDGLFDFNSEKIEALNERRYILNEQFIYTPDVKQKMLHLQDMLTQKIKDTVSFIQEFEITIDSDYRNGSNIIDSYDIEYYVHLFSHKKYDHIAKMKDKPFFSYLLCFYRRIGENYEDINHCPYSKIHHHTYTTYNQVNHPLKEIYHNTIMHDLFDHQSILSYLDIVDIEEISIEASIATTFEIKL